MLASFRYGRGQKHLIAIHDWISDSSSYQNTFSFLDPDIYTIHSLDLRGYGASKSISGQYDITEATHDILEYIKTNNITDCHLIAHSMGALIAQNLAYTAQETIKSITAITPIPPQGSPIPDVMRGFILAAALDDDILAGQMLNFITSQQFHHYFIEKKLNYWRSCSTAEARIGYFNMYTTTDIALKVKGLKQPILVITGKYDVEANSLQLMKDKFTPIYPQCDFIELPCSHYPMTEMPLQLAKIIDDFTRNIK